MRALVCTALTGIGSLVVQAMPTPTPRPGEALIQVAAAGLNYPDLLSIQGLYQHRSEPPFIPGLETAGTIVEIGSGVDPAWIGRRVMTPARKAFAEYVTAPVADVMIVPSGWTLEQAATFPVAARTAFHALIHRARLEAGETLVVHGASGGTGHMAIKIGKALGARVIATTGDPAKAAQLATFGADAVIDSRAADLADQLKAEAGGSGANVVFDPVGGAVFEASLKAAAFGARLLIVGFVGGGPDTVRTNYALIKGLSVLGVRAGEAARHSPRIAESYRAELPTLLARHDLKPHVAAAIPLADAAHAFDLLRSRATVGKIALRP